MEILRFYSSGVGNFIWGEWFEFNYDAHFSSFSILHYKEWWLYAIKKTPIFWIICTGRVEQMCAESPDMGKGEYWFPWENTCHLEKYGRASCSILWVTSHQWKRSGASMTTWLLYRGPSLLAFSILRVMLLPNHSWKSFLSDKTSLSTAIGWQGFEKGRQRMKGAR